MCAGPEMASEWCVIPDPDPAMVAPGGVVLCVKDTATPHPKSVEAATRAWEVLAEWERGPRCS